MAAYAKGLDIGRVQETNAPETPPLCGKHNVHSYGVSPSRSEESVTSFANVSHASDEFGDEIKDRTQKATGIVTLFRGSPEERYSCLVIWIKRLRISFLTIFTLACAVLYSAYQEQEVAMKIIYIRNSSHTEWYKESESWTYVTITLSGPFSKLSFQEKNVSCSRLLFMCGPNVTQQEPGLCPVHKNGSDAKLNCESVQILNNSMSYEEVTRTLDTVTGVDFYIHFFTSHANTVAFTVSVTGERVTRGGQAAIAFLILVFVYVLIIFELIHRTLAVMIGSIFVLGILSMLHKRPSLEMVAAWVDPETVSLLIGTMILVGIFSRTGFFDYAAVKTYRMARGHEWMLIILLCGLITLISAIVENVTTILLLVPVSIRLCQVLDLDPTPVLIAEVLFSNIGGAATVIGAPPNSMIFSHKSVKAAGIGFAEFTLHMFLGIILVTVSAYVTLAIMYTCCCDYVKWRNKDESHIAELRREINILERTAQCIPLVSEEEKLLKENLKASAMNMRRQLSEHRLRHMEDSLHRLHRTLAELEQQYCITDKILLAKSCTVVTVVIILFFMSSVIPKFQLGLGWIALFGAVILLTWSGIQDIEEVIHEIEWSTVLFFAGLLILVKGITLLGLLDYIGEKLVQIIMFVHPDNQNLVAIILILWVSAIVSAFVDNIPFVTAMIPAVVTLADSPDVCVDLKPMVWTLAFGVCLGGNATVNGAFSNVVCAGIAEQNGYKISFQYFAKIGFPMMIVTVTTAMVYLLTVHIALGWNIKKCVFSAGGGH